MGRGGGAGWAWERWARQGWAVLGGKRGEISCSVKRLQTDYIELYQVGGAVGRRVGRPSTVGWVKAGKSGPG